MADILEKITRYKREEVAAAAAKYPLQVMAEYARSAPRVRPFAGAIEAKLAAGQPALIAEIKKASPSKGLIRTDFEPVALAKAYEAGGAACLSVLTDTPSFQGAPELPHRRPRGGLAARAAQGLHDRHLSGGRGAARGAPTASSSSWRRWTMRSRADLAGAAKDWGMDAIVEVHDAAELDRALCASIAASSASTIATSKPSRRRWRRPKPSLRACRRTASSSARAASSHRPISRVSSARTSGPISSAKASCARPM